MPNGKVMRRVQFDFPPSEIKRLEELKTHMEATSYAEVVRYALRTVHMITERAANGEQLFMRTKDGKEKEIILVHLNP